MDEFTIPYLHWLKLRNDVPAEETLNVCVDVGNVMSEGLTVIKVSLKSRYLQEKYTFEVLKGTYG